MEIKWGGGTTTRKWTNERMGEEYGKEGRR